MLTTLLSPYFEKRNIVHAAPFLHFAVILYLYRACNITNEALNKIKTIAATRTIDGDKEDSEQERQDIIATLKDDLDWHAKSFALRLLVLPAQIRRMSSAGSGFAFYWIWHLTKNSPSC